MAFIGKSPQAGNYILLDSITTSATATYNLTRNSAAYFPASARNLIVSLNGITQAPDTAYSVSGSTITFSSALTASDVIDYILVLGDVLSIGTPADNTVGINQLNVSDGTSGQALTTDGSGTLSFSTVSSATPTLDAVTGAGATTTNAITVGKIISSTSENIAAAFTSTTTTAKLTITDANDTAFIDVNATRLGIGHASSTSLQALQIEPTSAEAMRIDSSGNVGIGTSSPSTILDIEGAWVNSHGMLALNATAGQYSGLSLQSAGAAKGYLYYDIPSDFLDLYSTNGIRLFAGGNTAVTIDSSLNVDMNGNLTAGDGTNISMSGTSTGQIKIDGDGYDGAIALDATGMHIYHNSASRSLIFGTNEIERMRITSSGTVQFQNAIEEQQYSLTGTAIDPSNGTIQYKTLTANTTFTESLSNGQFVTLMIDDGSGYTITWPTTTWVGGSAPTLGTSGYNVIHIWQINSVLYGAFIGTTT